MPELDMCTNGVKMRGGGGIQQANGLKQLMAAMLKSAGGECQRNFHSFNASATPPDRSRQSYLAFAPRVPSSLALGKNLPLCDAKKVGAPALTDTYVYTQGKTTKDEKKLQKVGGGEKKKINLIRFLPFSGPFLWLAFVTRRG